jgi:hypothetical protein
MDDSVGYPATLRGKGRGTYSQRRNHESQGDTRYQKQADKLRQQITKLGNSAEVGRDNNSTGPQTLERPTRAVQVVIVFNIYPVPHPITSKLFRTPSRNSTLRHIPTCRVSGLGDSLRTATAIASTTDD